MCPATTVLTLLFFKIINSGDLCKCRIFFLFSEMLVSVAVTLRIYLEAKCKRSFVTGLLAVNVQNEELSRA
jgi:hypothetical protein